VPRPGNPDPNPIPNPSRNPNPNSNPNPNPNPNRKIECHDQVPIPADLRPPLLVLVTYYLQQLLMPTTPNDHGQAPTSALTCNLLAHYYEPLSTPTHRPTYCPLPTRRDA
jgi:hypothetical protein